MQELLRQLERYLQDTLGVTTTAESWEPGIKLPQYLRDGYRFFKISILGTDYVLMVDTEDREQTPAVVGKHLDQVRSKHQVDLVYVRPAVSSHNRKRLIEQKVPFIVPGNQMYLPMLGIDLREYLRRLRESRPSFSPSTQALILHVLWSRETGVLTPADVAQQLGYSAMTMTRALDELEMAGIGEHSVKGKERQLRFLEVGLDLWQKVLPFLNSPVKRRFYIASDVKVTNGILAGESALATITMLASPSIPIYAFSATEWKVRTEKENILELTAPDPGGVEIEVWKYSPDRFAQEGKVDRLSLYLSLKDSPDERIQSSLEMLLDGMKW